MLAIRWFQRTPRTGPVALRARLQLVDLEARLLPSASSNLIGPVAGLLAQAARAHGLQALSPSHVVVVGPGQSLPAVAASALPGTTIFIQPGTYKLDQTIVVTQPDIALVGRPGVVIESDAPNVPANGIAVLGARDFTLVNVTVAGFGMNGVVLEGVDRFTLAQVTTINNGCYGLFPEFSTHGTIVNCTAMGHADTGIYVGQSAHVAIAGNRVFGNVNGIEIENSSDVQATGNESQNNVVGVLVDLLPGLVVKSASNIFVAGNFVHDNNHPNFAMPDDIAAAEPSGVGILVLGTNETRVRGNWVVGNHFAGIGVASTALLTAIAGVPVTDIQPNPTHTQVIQNFVSGNGTGIFVSGADRTTVSGNAVVGNAFFGIAVLNTATAALFLSAAIPGVVSSHTKVTDNVVVGNGFAGSPIPALLPAGVDLLWDGTGVDNRWEDNVFGSSFSPTGRLPR